MNATALMEGGCQCGAVRYRIEGAPLDLVVCHCRECQRQSASAFGMSLAVRTDQFTLLSGTLKDFEMRCDSGRVKTCSFCPACGVRIHHRTDERFLSVKAGTLDDPARLTPSAHYWVKRKLPWVRTPEDARLIEDDG